MLVTAIHFNILSRNITYIIAQLTLLALDTVHSFLSPSSTLPNVTKRYGDIIKMYIMIYFNSALKQCIVKSTIEVKLI